METLTFEGFQTGDNYSDPYPDLPPFGIFWLRLLRAISTFGQFAVLLYIPVHSLFYLQYFFFCFFISSIFVLLLLIPPTCQIVVSQIQGHMVGSSPPLPTTVRCLAFFIARRTTHFLLSSTRVETAPTAATTCSSATPPPNSNQPFGRARCRGIATLTYETIDAVFPSVCCRKRVLQHHKNTASC